MSRGKADTEYKHEIKIESRMKIEIINKSDLQDPEYKKEGDSGFDLRADIPNSILIAPFDRILVPTGIHVNLPMGSELQVRPRSGLAYKQGLTVLNTPGTVDYSYVDEIKVILINLSNEPQRINRGDRVAQAVIMPVYSEHVCKLSIVGEFETTKNRGGFGSTGVK